MRETCFGLVAVCLCGPGECESFVIQPKDVLVYGLDRRVLGVALRDALGFDESRGGAYSTLWVEEVGVYSGPVRTPVYFSCARGDALLRELERLMAVRDGPLVLLTPTGAACGQEVEGALRRGAGAHLPLSVALSLREGGGFERREALAPMLLEFAERLARGSELARTVQEIGRNLEAIAKGSYDLRSENSELRRLQSDGMLKFALRVEPADFQAFAAIIALGNRKAAAEFLDMPLRSFYDRIERWPGRGPDYRRMFRMLEWRKATDRRITLRLEDSLLSSGTGEGAENPETLAAVLATMQDRDGGGYPDILRQVLEALQEQNAGNWIGVRDELVGILREEVPQ